VSVGAEINVVNNQGLTLMHVASQGDQAYVLAYLRSVGMEFNEKDKKGGLPLHWAAYMGCETSASVLLS
jgi:FOG: Ankyrin repeat